MAAREAALIAGGPDARIEEPASSHHHYPQRISVRPPPPEDRAPRSHVHSARQFASRPCRAPSDPSRRKPRPSCRAAGSVHRLALLLDSLRRTCGHRYPGCVREASPRAREPRHTDPPRFGLPYPERREKHLSSHRQRPVPADAARAIWPKARTDHVATQRALLTTRCSGTHARAPRLSAAPPLAPRRRPASMTPVPQLALHAIPRRGGVLRTRKRVSPPSSRSPTPEHHKPPRRPQASAAAPTSPRGAKRRHLTLHHPPASATAKPPPSI
jgi:hypothetical protein